MSDTALPLETRLEENSSPRLIQAITDILIEYEDELREDEKDALIHAKSLMEDVQEAFRNRTSKRTKSLTVTERGQINFEATIPGYSIRMLCKSFKDGSAESSASGQEVVLRRKNNSVEVLIVDPTPLD